MDSTKMLVAAGADIDIRAVDGSTPLHVAAQHGHVDQARLLINAGAQVDVQDTKGRTPLEVAITRGEQETVRFLSEQRSTG